MSVYMRKPLCIVLLALVAGATGCKSSSTKYRHASGDIADRLAKQVERRTDPRLLRVMIYEFKPCASPPRGTYRPPSRGGAHSEREFASQIKHQLITALARRMVVVEGDVQAYPATKGRLARPAPVGEEADPYPEAETLDPYPEAEAPSSYPEAKHLGANAVLVGNYFVDGDKEVLVMARLVDVQTNEILATAEETIRRVKLPHQHR